MENLRILSREIYIKNRESKDSAYAFSILNIFVSEEVSKVIQSSLTSGFTVKIERYTLEAYSCEVPSTLYTDFPLYLEGEYLSTTEINKSED